MTDERGERNKRLFTRLIEEAFGKGDVAVIDELVAPQIVEHVPGAPNSAGYFKKVVTRLHQAFPDIAYTIEDLAIDGDKIWARLRARGTHRGDFMGHPATGKSVDVESFEIFRFEGDKMVEHWGVLDRVAIFQQLGLRP